MSKNLFVAATEPRSGKSVICLGLMELLLRDIENVAFFRPLITSTPSSATPDNDLALIASHFHLSTPHEEMYAYTTAEASQLLAMGRQEELLEGILIKYNSLAAKNDFVLCEGFELEGATASFDFDINADICNNLGCPVVLVAGAHRKTEEELFRSIKLYHESLEERGSEIIATIVNRLSPDTADTIGDKLRQAEINAGSLVYTIPNDDNLGNPTMAEIASLLDAKVMYGAGNLNRHVRSFTIAAMQIRNFLPRIEYGTLIVTPGDRSDVVLACLAASQSMSMPNISGILLTGGLVPEEPVCKVIEGYKDTFPIVSVQDNTFPAAIRVEKVHAVITPENERKITQALAVFEKHVNTEELVKKIVTTTTTIVTPKMFEYRLLQMAKRQQQHIVLPEGEDERILRAAEILVRREVVSLTLLGRQSKIEEKIKNLGLHLDRATIIEPQRSPLLEEFSHTYYELRKDKGITLDTARDLMNDLNYFGTMMIHKGYADGMVSGAMHTTAATIRPAFQFIKAKPGSSLISSVFMMCLADRVLVYGDCAINPNPNAEQLAEIALSSAQTATIFGINPVVAMLSYSTGASGQGEQVEKVREATRIARSKAAVLYPSLKLEGPIQYDAAIDPGVAHTKMPDSEVAGKATVFIFPDLNTGNNTYKAVQRSAGAVAIGPILQGLNKPVNDLSRGCLVPDIVNTVAITAIQAQAEKRFL